MCLEPPGAPEGGAQSGGATVRGGPMKYGPHPCGMNLAFLPSVLISDRENDMTNLKLALVLAAAVTVTTTGAVVRNAKASKEAVQAPASRIAKNQKEKLNLIGEKPSAPKRQELPQNPPPRRQEEQPGRKDPASGTDGGYWDLVTSGGGTVEVVVVLGLVSEISDANRRWIDQFLPSSSLLDMVQGIYLAKILSPDYWESVEAARLFIQDAIDRFLKRDRYDSVAVRVFSADDLDAKMLFANRNEAELKNRYDFGNKHLQIVSNESPTLANVRRHLDSTPSVGFFFGHSAVGGRSLELSEGRGETLSIHDPLRRMPSKDGIPFKLVLHGEYTGYWAPQWARLFASGGWGLYQKPDNREFAYAPATWRQDQDFWTWN